MRRREWVHLLLMALVLVTARPLVQGGLRWETQKIDLTPKAGDAFVEAKFSFVNEGQGVEAMESVSASCGCVTATATKSDYAPGERGAVLVRFRIGDRRGLQEVKIRVRLRRSVQPVVLSMNVTLPEVAKITPSILTWSAGEKLDPKVIEVEAMPGESIQVLKVNPSSPDFEVRWQVVEEAAKYRIVVTPRTLHPTFALLHIEAQLPSGGKMLCGYAQVKR